MIKTNEALIASLGYSPTDYLGGGFCTEVYQACDSEENTRILKFPRLETHNGTLIVSRSGIRHIVRESRALKRAEGIEGISQYVELHDWGAGILPALGDFLRRGEYRTDRQVALVKEYIPGNGLTEADNLDESRAGFIERTVRALHEVGIAVLDLKPKNVIITPEDSQYHGNPYLIDLGTARFREEDPAEFEKNRTRDLQHLERALATQAV